MVILRSQNKITDFLMTLAWASPFNYHTVCYLCEIVGHFEFYPPKNPPMNIQSKICVASPDLIQDRGTQIF